MITYQFQFHHHPIQSPSPFTARSVSDETALRVVSNSCIMADSSSCFVPHSLQSSANPPMLSVIKCPWEGSDKWLFNSPSHIDISRSDFDVSTLKVSSSGNLVSVLLGRTTKKICSRLYNQMFIKYKAPTILSGWNVSNKSVLSTNQGTVLLQQDRISPILFWSHHTTFGVKTIPGHVTLELVKWSSLVSKHKSGLGNVRLSFSFDNTCTILMFALRLWSSDNSVKTETRGCATEIREWTK